MLLSAPVIVLIVIVYLQALFTFPDERKMLLKVSI